MARELRFHSDARERLKAGVDGLADAIKVTLGPRGRNAILERLTGPPLITNDGVTIAQEIEFSEPFANMGVQLVKEAAMKTNHEVGDGTTTATVLAQALVEAGFKAVDDGANPMQLRRGIEKAVPVLIDGLRAEVREVNGTDQVRHIATLAAGDDDAIGDVIAQAIEHVGRNGVVDVEGTDIPGVSVEVVDGISFDHGYITPYMVTDRQRMEAVFDDPAILLTNQTISQVQELMPAVEAARRVDRPLVIVAEDVDGPALQMLTSGIMHDTFSSCVVRAPGFGHRRTAELEDLATALGGTVVSKDSGLELMEMHERHFGGCDRITITEDFTTIVGGHGSQTEINARIEQIGAQLERAKIEHDQDSLQLRQSRLSGTVAAIKVGGATSVELKERLLRVEDSLNAARAALEEGVVAGGGAALARAREMLGRLELTGDEAIGREVVAAAVSEPLRLIADNAGYDGAEVVQKVLGMPPGTGLDAAEGEYVDLFDAGVIDPLKVTRAAVEAAASVSGLLITTETAVVEEVIVNPGSVIAPGFGDLAEGMVRPSNIY